MNKLKDLVLNLDPRYFRLCVRKGRAIAITECQPCRFAEWEDDWFTKLRADRKILCTLAPPAADVSEPSGEEEVRAQ